jgi:serine/threonine protein kinase
MAPGTEQCVESSLIIDALGHAARKRRLLDAEQATRLVGVLRNRGLESLERLRGWLAGSNGMSVALARELLKILARHDQPAFGHYKPLAHLANGGMGSVWLAANRTGDGLVVIKSMRKDVGENEEFQKRFARETRIMMELNGPGVVHCIDSGKAADNTLFMVLEFVDGGDLKDLAEGRGVPEVMALQFVCHVGLALAAAHKRQLVHRDIKPANIFAYPDGRAKLADFGIARSTSEHRTMLTMQGAMVGSPPNMSPEQVMGDGNLDIRSDIYSLGTVLYFALTGSECYQGKLQEVLHAHRTAPVPDVRKARPEVSQATADIITRCMQKKREERYQDPDAFGAAVGAALSALGQVPGSLHAIPKLPPRTPAPLTAEREMTETMLARLASTDANAQGDSSVLLGQKTPTGFNAPSFRHASGETPREIGTAVVQPALAPGESMSGDHANAHAGHWLSLVGDGPQRLVMLLAKTRLDMGKLREPPIDLCLRNYPLTEHRDACLRVSRRHLDVVYEPARSAVALVDAGSGNGTVVDGAPLPPNKPLTLTPDRDHNAVVAGAVTLRLRCLSRRGGSVKELAGVPAATAPGACGIDTDHAFDAVTLTRPANRPETAYVMVLRRLSLGGAGADLVLHGATTPGACELALFGGRWIWRATAGSGPWQPLTIGTKLDCGGVRLGVRAGSFEDFG